jgi:hypothetical protein
LSSVSLSKSLDKNYRQRDRNRNSNTQNGKECPKSKAAPTHLNPPFLSSLPPSLSQIKKNHNQKREKAKEKKGVGER